jgi:hypothetical protein
MAPEASGKLNPFFAVKVDIPDTYFSLWTITEEGERDPTKVQQALEMASAELRELGGKCQLFVTMGGPADLIGVAKGPVNEAGMLALQRAVQATGVLTAVFFKAIEFTAGDFAKYTSKVESLRKGQSRKR